MLRTTTAALLVSTALLTGSAIAQTSPATTTTFVQQQDIGQFRASKFSGLDVYGSEDQKIGDISEILLDSQGNAKAVVIGVGGFLGIGQKSVAVPWSALTWVNERPASLATANAPATTGTTAPVTTPVPTAVTAPAAPPPRSPAEQAAFNGYPDHATVKLTKAELQNAPAFTYYAETSTTATAPSNAAPPTRPQ